MADIDPESTSGKSPEFMTTGWHGHKAMDINKTPASPMDNRNCREPSFDSEVDREY